MRTIIAGIVSAVIGGIILNHYQQWFPSFTPFTDAIEEEIGKTFSDQKRQCFNSLSCEINWYNKHSPCVTSGVPQKFKYECQTNDESVKNCWPGKDDLYIAICRKSMKDEEFADLLPKPIGGITFFLKGFSPPKAQHAP